MIPSDIVLKNILSNITAILPFVADLNMCVVVAEAYTVYLLLAKKCVVPHQSLTRRSNPEDQVGHLQSPPSPQHLYIVSHGSMNKREVVVTNTDFPALCSQILKTTSLFKNYHNLLLFIIPQKLAHFLLYAFIS